MIALTNCIGKVFHLILAKRTTSFILANKLIDITVQKGFLPKIDGCIEHNMLLDEVLSDVKNEKETAHITFF